MKKKILAYILSGVLVTNVAVPFASVRPSDISEAETASQIEPVDESDLEDIPVVSGDTMDVVETWQAVGQANRKQIENAEIVIADADYTGREVMPTPTVRYGSIGTMVILEEGQDYTVSYADNVYPGRASVIITGMNDYSGVASKSFRISADLSETDIQYETEYIRRDGAEDNEPVITLGKSRLMRDADYAVSYTVEDTDGDLSTVRMDITGMGYYKGKQSRTYKALNNALSVEAGQAYKVLLSGDINRCVSVEDSAKEDDPIVIRDNTDVGEDAMFFFRFLGNESWEIVSQLTDGVLHSENKQSPLGHGILASLEEEMDRYQIRSNGDGTFTFAAARGEMVLNASKEGAMQMYMPSGASNEKFYLIPVKATLHTYTGTYNILSATDNNFALTIQSGMKRKKANTILDAFRNEKWQVFRILYAGNDTYRIRCEHSGRFLTITDTLGNNANVAQDRWADTDSQKWAITETPDGSFVFENNGFALNLPCGQAQRGGNVDVFTMNDTQAQKWLLRNT